MGLGEGIDVTVLEALDVAVTRVDDRLGDQPEIEAAVRETIGRTYTALDRLDEAERELTESLRIRAGCSASSIRRSRTACTRS